MDKWTREFISNDPSQEFHNVIQMPQARSIQKWARDHSEDAFGGHLWCGADSNLCMEPGAYVQLGKSGAKRETWRQAILFLLNLSNALFELDFRFTHNLSRINQARRQNWGIRLNHIKRCPVHTRNAYDNRSFSLIQPVVHPDCDAEFDPILCNKIGVHTCTRQPTRSIRGWGYYVA